MASRDPQALIIDLTPAQAMLYGALGVAISAAAGADDTMAVVDLLNARRRFMGRLLEVSG